MIVDFIDHGNGNESVDAATRRPCDRFRSTIDNRADFQL